MRERGGCVIEFRKFYCVLERYLLMQSGIQRVSQQPFESYLPYKKCVVYPPNPKCSPPNFVSLPIYSLHFISDHLFRHGECRSRSRYDTKSSPSLAKIPMQCSLFQRVESLSYPYPLVGNSCAGRTLLMVNFRVALYYCVSKPLPYPCCISSPASQQTRLENIFTFTVFKDDGLRNASKFDKDKDCD